MPGEEWWVCLVQDFQIGQLSTKSSGKQRMPGRRQPCAQPAPPGDLSLRHGADLLQRPAFIPIIDSLMASNDDVRKQPAPSSVLSILLRSHLGQARHCPSPGITQMPALTRALHPCPLLHPEASSCRLVGSSVQEHISLHQSKSTCASRTPFKYHFKCQLAG